MDLHLDRAVIGIDETAQPFLLWAFQTLGFVVQDDGPLHTLRVPEEFTGELGEEVSFRFSNDTADADRLTTDSPLFRWLYEQLRMQPLAAAPVDQPAAVHAISNPLFAAYEIEGGTVHLAGCSLEDRPFLRLTYLVESDGQAGLSHHYFTSSGERVPDALFESLAFESLEAFPGTPPRLTKKELGQWVESAGKAALGEQEKLTLFATTVLWCKYAEGKLTFVIGEAQAMLPFAGWARHLSERLTPPPPFHCPHSGAESYRLVRTDRGDITVREAVDECQETGQRVFRDQLEVCEATGKRAVAAAMATCPVTGQHVVRSALTHCKVCQQSVSPGAIEDGTCRACRTMQPLSKDDPRMARVLGQFPRLDRWRRWRFAETETVYILASVAVMKRLLVVVDKESLEITRLAVGNRFSRNWNDAPVAEWNDYRPES